MKKRTENERIRGLKYFFELNTDLKKFHTAYNAALSEMNEYVFANIFANTKLLHRWHEITTPKKAHIQALAGDIQYRKGCTNEDATAEAKLIFGAHTVEAGYCLPDLFWSDLQQILIKHGFSVKNRHFLKSMTTFILDQYKGVNRRFSRWGKVRRLNFKEGKAIRIPRGIMKDQHPSLTEGKLFLCHFNSQPIELEYKCLSNEDAKKEVNIKQLGGNLCFFDKSAVFTVQRKTKQKFAYNPATWIGFDINAEDTSFITFDDGYKIEQTCRHIIEALAVCSKKRHEKTKKITDRKIRHQQRRYWNAKAVKLHKKLKRAYYPVIKEIVDRAEGKKACLCIDEIMPRVRTFGNDHIIREVVKMCQDRGVPYALVPPYYTSKTCSTCEHTFDNPKTGYGRISTGVFKCGEPNCKDYDIQKCAQINAAKNIMKRGKDMTKGKLWV